MAVQITSSGTTFFVDRARFPLRFGSGIPICGYSSISVGQITLAKGNGVVPTSFSTIFSQTGVPYDDGHNTWVMISPTLAMCGEHFYSGMTQQLKQWTVNEQGSNNGGAVITTLDDVVSAANKVFDTAVDSNGALHVIYTDLTTNMGTAYLTLYYINNVGGSWNTRVEIYGASSTVNFANQRQPTIIIDSANLPIVSAPASSGTNTWKRGNANNATSFENQALSASATYGHNTVGCDIRGNHYVFARAGAGDLRIDKHASGASWGTTTNTTLSNKEFDQLYGVRIHGDYAYVVFKDQTNNASGVSIAKIDISGTTPTYVTTLERTTDDWYEFEATMKNSPLYHNYDKNGVDVGNTALAKEIDLCMNLFDGGSENDPYWESFQIAPTIALNTADASDFTDTTPTLEETGDEIFNLDTLEYDVQIFDTAFVGSVVDSYSEAFQDGTSGMYIGFNEAFSQSFTGNGKYLTRATFNMSKSGTPTGIARARLYAHSGTYGTSSLPTGNPLATSDYVDVSTLTGTSTLTNFDFDGEFLLVNGTYYCIVIEIFGTTSNSTNTIQVGDDSGSPTHSGNRGYYRTSTGWTASATYDICFYIYGNSRLLDRSSDVDTSEFVNTVTGGDTHPFNDAEKIAFTVEYGTFDSYLDEDTDAQMYSGNFTARGQSFHGINGDLSAVQFLLKKLGSPTGNAVAKLYAHSGSYGTSSVPTGTALATSNTFDVSQLTTTAQWIKFVFPTPYTMSSGTDYVVVVEYTGGNVTNQVIARLDGSGAAHSGNESQYSGSWSAVAAADMAFIVEGTIELSIATYYWRARARSGGLTGYWSAIRYFTISAISSNVSKIKVTAWKDWAGAQINIGGTWKTITAVKINIGGVWKDADITP